MQPRISSLVTLFEAAKNFWTLGEDNLMSPVTRGVLAA
jgi:hypothetical protein